VKTSRWVVPALILAYATATADLTPIGGPANQTVINGVVQEIDIATGKVLFQWNSADHVPFSQSEQPLPASPSTPWDWFHINAVHVDGGNSLLIDARNTWTTYRVNRHSGEIDIHMIRSDDAPAQPGRTLEQRLAAGPLEVPKQQGVGGGSRRRVLPAQVRDDSIEAHIRDSFRSRGPCAGQRRGAEDLGVRASHLN